MTNHQPADPLRIRGLTPFALASNPNVIRRARTVLVVYRPMTTWPGMVIVLLGLLVYYLWKWRR